MADSRIPNNFPDCFALLEQTVDAEALERLRQLSPGGLMLAHLSWGLLVRNKFIHPRDSAIRDKIAALPGMVSHHDSYGSFLLKAFWLHLNGKQGPQALFQWLEEQDRNQIYGFQELIESGFDGNKEIVEELVKIVEFIRSREKPTLADLLPLFTR